MIPVLHGVWAAAGGLVGDFEHIETQTVGAGGAASVTFSSIPGTYKHLELRATTAPASGAPNLLLKINSDGTAGNYYRHALYGNGSSAFSNAGGGIASLGGYIGYTSASYPGVFVAQILDYASTSKYKTVRGLTGVDENGAGSIALRSILWMSTSAITSLTVNPDSGSLPQHSTYALYGVK